MFAIDQIVGQPQVNPYAANTPVQQTLERNGIYDEIAIRVSGTLTLAGYTVAPTKRVEAVQNLIGLVQLSATGAIAETFKSCGNDWFSRQVQLLEGTAPYLTDVGTANQAYAFENQSKLYLRGAGKWRRPLDTLLDSRLLANLTLTLNWRDASAMVTGGTGGTATLSGTQATLMARLWMGVAPDQTPGFGHLKESEIIQTVQASQQDLSINSLPVGNLIRRIAIKGMVGNTAYADPSDSIFDPTRVKNIHVRDGAVYPVGVGYLDLRARNKVQYQLEAMPAGLAVWEPSMHGTPMEQYDARGKKQLELLADVIYTGGNTNTLAIRTVEHVLPKR